MENDMYKPGSMDYLSSLVYADYFENLIQSGGWYFSGNFGTKEYIKKLEELYNVSSIISGQEDTFKSLTPEAKDIMAREMYTILTHGLTKEHIQAFGGKDLHKSEEEYEQAVRDDLLDKTVDSGPKRFENARELAEYVIKIIKEEVIPEMDITFEEKMELASKLKIHSPSQFHMKQLEQDVRDYEVKNGTVNGAELFQEIVDGMLDVYKAKNHDYGNSFDLSLDEDGLVAAKVRIGDKFNRFGNLIRKENKVSDESLEDTLLDMANYAIMTVMWMRGQKQ